MFDVELNEKKHGVKVGDYCLSIDPNIKEDCFFLLNGEKVGFFLNSIGEDEKKYLRIANHEFNSKRVPKTEMSRGPQGSARDKEIRKLKGETIVTQYSAIIGGMTSKPHMKRDYPNVSSLHGAESAKFFIKAMNRLMACAEETFKELMPEAYERQRELVCKTVDKRYRLGDVWTSSISNYNIAAKYHKDTGNIKQTINFIYTKRHRATGGNLSVPDYGVCVNQNDESLLAYPAWMSLHGVTPIVTDTGYRNSFVFYPLNIN